MVGVHAVYSSSHRRRAGVLSVFAVIVALLAPPGSTKASVFNLNPFDVVLKPTMQEAASPRDKEVDSLSSTSVAASPGHATSLKYESASIEIGPRAVSAKTVISVATLPEQDIPALDEGMTNVTLGPNP